MKAAFLLEDGDRFERAGLYPRALECYRRALDKVEGEAEPIEVHLRLARVHRALCNWEDAIREARDAMRLAREHGSDDLAAEAANAEVGVWQLRGDLVRAEALAREALGFAQAPRVKGILLQNLGSIAAQQRKFELADQLHSQSADCYREAGYDRGLAMALNNAAAAALDRGDGRRALDLAREAAEAAQRIDALETRMIAIENQAHALALLGSTEEARALLSEALGHFSAGGNLLRYAECLSVLGQAYEAETDGAESAIRSYRLALALARHLGDALLQHRVESRLLELTKEPGLPQIDGQAAAELPVS